MSKSENSSINDKCINLRQCSLDLLTSQKIYVFQLRSNIDNNSLVYLHTVKLGYNELGYNEHCYNEHCYKKTIFKSKMVILLHKSIRL